MGRQDETKKNDTCCPGGQDIFFLISPVPLTKTYLDRSLYRLCEIETMGSRERERENVMVCMASSCLGQPFIFFSVALSYRSGLHGQCQPAAGIAAAGSVRTALRVPEILPQDPMGRLGSTLKETAGQIRSRALLISRRHVSLVWTQNYLS